MSKTFNWMPVLRTGTFTDKNNQAVTIDEAKLDTIVAATDLKNSPQLVIEHPSFDEIGFGSISQLKRVGKFLFALPDKVEDKFKNAVNSGRLPGRSVTLDKKNFSLRNISFLPPSVPPAVSGLGAYCFEEAKDKAQAEVLNMSLALPGVESHFAEVEEDKFEFAAYEVSNYPFRSIQSVMRNIKNFFIEKFSLEISDRVIPEWMLTEIGTPPYIYEKKENYQATSFSQNLNGDKMNKVDLSKIDFSKVDPALKSAIEALQEINTQQTVELQAATTKLTAAEAKEVETEVLQFCASPEVAKKVTPAIKDKVVSTLVSLKGKPVIELSGADKTKVQFNAFDFVKDLVKMLPDAVSDIELATNTTAGAQTPEYIKTAKAIADSVNR